MDKASYVDKVGEATTKTQSGNITIAGEVDRVYTSPNGAKDIVAVVEGGKKKFEVKKVCCRCHIQASWIAA